MGDNFHPLDRIPDGGNSQGSFFWVSFIDAETPKFGHLLFSQVQEQKARSKVGLLRCGLTLMGCLC